MNSRWNTTGSAASSSLSPVSVLMGKRSRRGKCRLRHKQGYQQVIQPRVETDNMSLTLEDPRIVEFDVRTDEMLVNMGPQHPSTHGVLRLLLRTDGENVNEVVPHIGYLHR